MENWRSAGVHPTPSAFAVFQTSQAPAGAEAGRRQARQSTSSPDEPTTLFRHLDKMSDATVSMSILLVSSQKKGAHDFERGVSRHLRMDSRAYVRSMEPSNRARLGISRRGIPKLSWSTTHAACSFGKKLPVPAKMRMSPSSRRFNKSLKQYQQTD
jgi:hypothetical protein